MRSGTRWRALSPNTSRRAPRGKRSAPSPSAVTASPGSRACPRPWPASCSSSRTASGAWRSTWTSARSASSSSASSTRSRGGRRARPPGEGLSAPVGDTFLGRVVGPLGEPLDGKGPIEDTELRPLETQAPSVVERQPVKEPLQTGIKAIDAMTAIGRGQRQLIIGDRQTGKTAIAIDAIINQKANWDSGDPARQVRCVYVAVGQKGSTIASVRQSLEEAGSLEYTTIVAAPASDPAGYKYTAPN